MPTRTQRPVAGLNSLVGAVGPQVVSAVGDFFDPTLDLTDQAGVSLIDTLGATASAVANGNAQIQIPANEVWRLIALSMSADTLDADQSITLVPQIMYVSGYYPVTPAVVLGNSEFGYVGAVLARPLVMVTPMALVGRWYNVTVGAAGSIPIFLHGLIHRLEA